MTATPYFIFNGNCREAFEFYADVLNGEITHLQTHADSPVAAETPPERQHHVLHASLRAGDLVLLASDSPPEHYLPPQGVFTSLAVDSVEESERIFAALSEGGTVFMPLEETFWAKRFAMFTDRFGTPWMINCE